MKRALKEGKRRLAILLAALMVISVLPVNALSEVQAQTTETEVSEAGEIGEGSELILSEDGIVNGTDSTDEVQENSDEIGEEVSDEEISEDAGNEDSVEENSETEVEEDSEAEVEEESDEVEEIEKSDEEIDENSKKDAEEDIELQADNIPTVTIDFDQKTRYYKIYYSGVNEDNKGKYGLTADLYVDGHFYTKWWGAEDAFVINDNGNLPCQLCEVDSGSEVTLRVVMIDTETKEAVSDPITYECTIFNSGRIETPCNFQYEELGDGKYKLTWVYDGAEHLEFEIALMAYGSEGDYRLISVSNPPRADARSFTFDINECPIDRSVPTWYAGIRAVPSDFTEGYYSDWAKVLVLGEEHEEGDPTPIRVSLGMNAISTYYVFMEFDTDDENIWYQLALEYSETGETGTFNEIQGTSYWFRDDPRIGVGKSEYGVGGMPSWVTSFTQSGYYRASVRTTGQYAFPEYGITYSNVIQYTAPETKLQNPEDVKLVKKKGSKKDEYVLQFTDNNDSGLVGSYVMEFYVNDVMRYKGSFPQGGPNVSLSYIPICNPGNKYYFKVSIISKDLTKARSSDVATSEVLDRTGDALPALSTITMTASTNTVPVGRDTSIFTRRTYSGASIQYSFNDDRITFDYGDGSVLEPMETSTWSSDGIMLKGAKIGKQKVSVKYNGTSKASLDISVFGPDKSELKIVKGETDTLKITDTGTKKYDTEWSSLDDSIATVDADGKITAAAVGETIIKAKVQYKFGTNDAYEEFFIPVTVQAPYEYTVKFDGNKPENGEISGNMDEMETKYGEEFSLSANTFAVPGYTFKGWNDSKADADAGKVKYADKQQVKNVKDSAGEITLYAVWELDTYSVKSVAGNYFIGYTENPSGASGKVLTKKINYYDDYNFWVKAKAGYVITGVRVESGNNSKDYGIPSDSTDPLCNREVGYKYTISEGLAVGDVSITVTTQKIVDLSKCTVKVLAYGFEKTPNKVEWKSGGYAYEAGTTPAEGKYCVVVTNGKETISPVEYEVESLAPGSLDTTIGINAGTECIKITAKSKSLVCTGSKEATVTVQGIKITDTKRVYIYQPVKSILYSFAAYTPLEGIRVFDISAAPKEKPVIGETAQFPAEWKELTKDADFKLIYSNYSSVGTATVSVIGIGGYEGSKDIKYSITKPSFSKNDGLEIDGISDVVVYNGKAQTFDITVNYAGVSVGSNDYTVKYSKNIEAGKATVTINGKNNLTGSVKKEFVISKLDIGEVECSMPAVKKAKNPKAKPVLVLKDEAGNVVKTLIEKKDYVLENYDYSGLSEEGVGTVLVDITGKGSFEGSYSTSFKVVDKDLSNSKVCKLDDKAIKALKKYFTGAAIELSDDELKAIVKGADGIALNPDEDYEVSYSPQPHINVGNVTVTITGKGEYCGSKSFKFSIQKRTITTGDADGPGGKNNVSDMIIYIDGTPYSIPHQYYFTGYAIKPEVNIFDNRAGYTLKEGTDYTLSYSNNTNAGSTKKALVKITYKGNYTGVAKEKTGSVSVEYEILPWSLNDTSIAKPYAPNDFLYMNGKEVKTGVIYQVKKGPDSSEYVDVNSKSYKYEYSNNKNIGTATVKVVPAKGAKDTNLIADSSGNNAYVRNYNIKSVDISNSSYMAISKISPQVYKGKAIVPKFTVKYNGTALKEGKDYKIDDIDYPENMKGEATIKICGIGNFFGSTSITFIIK